MNATNAPEEAFLDCNTLHTEGREYAEGRLEGMDSTILTRVLYRVRKNAKFVARMSRVGGNGVLSAEMRAIIDSTIDEELEKFGAQAKE